MAANPFCRLCALKSDSYVDIFNEEGQKLNLCSKINQCLQIWLFPEDILPKTVCIDCCTKVEEYSDFFNLCSRSQVSLMEIFNGERNGGTILNGTNESEEIKPFKENTTVVAVCASDGEGDGGGDISDYGVECVILDKSRSAGGRKRKRRCSREAENGEGGRSTQEKLKDQEQQEPLRKQLHETGQDSTDNETEEIDNLFDGSPPTTTKNILEGYNWECTDCDQVLATLSTLKTHHQDVHNQPPVFKCTKCGKVYTRYRSFARHVKLHGNHKKFSCDKCGKSFSQKTVLQSHGTVHSEERPHVCNQCGKAFKQFSSLYLHTKCHLPDQVKPKFPCTICPKEFSTKHTLDTHMKIHTGERNYVCDICGRSFIAKGSLDYHMLTHNDAKPHSCSVCGKSFKTMRLLGKHSTLHTGVKPHQCDVCGKQFRERGALKEHNRIHTGAMPYSCEFCGKLFRFKGILTVHRRQHTGERPYSCSDCNREFTNWANYNKHMKRRHRNSDSNHQQQQQQETPVGGMVAVDEHQHQQHMMQQLPAESQAHHLLHPHHPHHLVTMHQQQPPPPPAPPPPPPPPPPPSLQTYSVTEGPDSGVYKLPQEQHDVYSRVVTYPPPPPPPPLQMSTINYYIPPIHGGVLQMNQ